MLRIGSIFGALWLVTSTALYVLRWKGRPHDRPNTCGRSQAGKVACLTNVAQR